MLGAIQRLLKELSADPNHALRQRFDASLARFIERLNTSPEFAARVDAWKEEFLDNDAARSFSASLWQDAKAALARYASNPESKAPGVIENALTTFGQKAVDDPELLAKLDEFAVDVAVFLVGRYQDEVAELIATTVSGVGPRAHVAPRRARDRAGSSVHSHQRHDRRRAGGNDDLLDLVALSVASAAQSAARRDCIARLGKREWGESHGLASNRSSSDAGSSPRAAIVLRERDARDVRPICPS